MARPGLGCANFVVTRLVGETDACRHRVPKTMLTRLTSLGEILSHDAAAKCGFLDRVVPASALEQECMAAAKDLADNVRARAYQQTKEGERAIVSAAMRANLPIDMALFGEDSKL